MPVLALRQRAEEHLGDLPVGLRGYGQPRGGGLPECLGWLPFPRTRSPVRGQFDRDSGCVVGGRHIHDVNETPVLRPFRLGSGRFDRNPLHLTLRVGEQALPCRRRGCARWFPRRRSSTLFARRGPYGPCGLVRSQRVEHGAFAGNLQEGRELVRRVGLEQRRPNMFALAVVERVGAVAVGKQDTGRHFDGDTVERGAAHGRRDFAGAGIVEQHQSVGMVLTAASAQRRGEGIRNVWGNHRRQSTLLHVTAPEL